jgi:hypothetical protein
MKGIYTYIPETSNVPKEYNVAAIVSYYYYYYSCTSSSSSDITILGEP